MKWGKKKSDQLQFPSPLQSSYGKLQAKMLSPRATKLLLPLNFASMRTRVYVELHQTGEKLAWGQTGPLGGSRLPQLSLFLSPSVAI